ncbi:MAG: transposase [bacterium]|nr:transposase [bacterium]
MPEPHDLVRRYEAAVDVPAFGGRLEVDWSPGERVTSVGGLVFFATFLKETGLFDRLCEDFPVCYRSNNSSSKRDIVGTAVLAILLGKTRYVHIEAIRHDEAARELFGLGEIVSDATVRRANEKKLDAWLLRHEREVYEPLLVHRYVIDIDNTVKPIYGHQEGVELGYNPIKPGRPSHNYHSFFIGKARIALGVDVRPGKQHFGRCGVKRLWALIDALPPNLWPAAPAGSRWSGGSSSTGGSGDAVCCSYGVPRRRRSRPSSRGSPAENRRSRRSRLRSSRRFQQS